MTLPDPLEPGLSEPSDEVGAILAQALDLAEEEGWTEMVEFLGRSLDEHPGDPYLLCWIGMAERELGSTGAAYEHFREALAAEPRDPVLLATAGNALAAFDDPAAEAALRTAALLAPDLAQTRWMYGAYLAREGMIEDALHHLDAAIALDPDDPIVQTEQGVARALGGDLQGAIDSFSRAGELDPEDGWSLILLGLSHLHLGDLDEGARALDEGARLRPEDVEGQILAALALCGVGWEDRALEMLERARVDLEGADFSLVSEAESKMEEGSEAAVRFLTGVLSPSSFRDRLNQRP